MALYANAHVKNGKYDRFDFYPDGEVKDKAVDPEEFQKKVNEIFEARKLKKNG